MTRLRNRVGSLENLTAFEASARHQNFTHAAQELRVSQPAISRRIQDLEDRLGVLLFNRSGKRLTLTPAGRALQLTMTRALSDIEGKLAELSALEDAGAVSLRITPANSSWVLPALGSLCTAFPETPVHLICLDAKVNPRKIEYDLLLSFTASGGASEHQHLMLEGEVFPVAGRHFLQDWRKGIEDAPLYQMKHPFVRALDWNAWFPERAGKLDVRIVPSYGLALDAAVTGKGLALAWKYSAGPHIETGRLVKCGDAKRRTRYAEYLFVSPQRANDAAVQKVAGWLRDYAQQTRERFRDL